LASGLPVSVSSVPRPVLVLVPVSAGGAPMASLNVGTLGFGPSAQTVSRNFTVLACMALAWATAWSGTPQLLLLSSRNFTTLSSAAVKLCTAAHMSLRSPLRLPITETASAFALASSRNLGKLAQIPDCGGGPPIWGPPIGGPPCVGPDGNTDCCGAAGNGDDCCGAAGNCDCWGGGGNGDCASAACESVAPAAKTTPIATTRLRFIAIPCGSPNP
jgi:hypothetical protein